MQTAGAVLVAIGEQLPGGLSSFVTHVETVRSASLGQKAVGTAEASAGSQMLHEAQQVFAAETLDLQRFPGLSFNVHLAHTSYGWFMPDEDDLEMYLGKRVGLLDKLEAEDGNDDAAGLVCGLLETEHPVLSRARLLEKSAQPSTACTRAALSRTGKVGERAFLW